VRGNNRDPMEEHYWRYETKKILRKKLEKKDKKISELREMYTQLVRDKD